MKVRKLWKILHFLALAHLLMMSRELSCRRQPSELRLTFLDVGKGDAMVVRTPSGKTLVVDTGGALRGGDDQGNRTIAPFLRKQGIRMIDVLLLTHPHPDHVGGAYSLLRQFRVGKLIDNGRETSSPLVQRYRAVAREKAVPIEVMARGQKIDLDRAVCIYALAPPSTGAQENINNTSLVLRVEYGKTSFLLTGDAESESEKEMVAARQSLKADVLKVAHHGSNKATSAFFLRAVRPRIAIISVNANNRTGYPHPAVLQRLKQIDAQVYRTDRNGPITCTSDGVTVKAAPTVP